MAVWIRTQDNVLLEIESGTTITSSYDEGIEHYTSKARLRHNPQDLMTPKPLLKATFERLCNSLVRNRDLDFRPYAQTVRKTRLVKMNFHSRKGEPFCLQQAESRLRNGWSSGTWRTASGG